MFVTARDKHACAQREVAMRKNVYARLIAEKTVDPKQAKRQLEIMEAIAEDYRILAEAEAARDRLI